MDRSPPHAELSDLCRSTHRFAPLDSGRPDANAHFKSHHRARIALLRGPSRLRCRTRGPTGAGSGHQSGRGTARPGRFPRAPAARCRQRRAGDLWRTAGQLVRLADDRQLGRLVHGHADPSADRRVRSPLRDQLPEHPLRRQDQRQRRVLGRNLVLPQVPGLHRHRQGHRLRVLQADPAGRRVPDRTAGDGLRDRRARSGSSRDAGRVRQREQRTLRGQAARGHAAQPDHRQERGVHRRRR
jgi:hypothetical protein